VLTIPAQPGTLYRVQQGDTLETISSRTGISVEDIVSASQLQTASVRPGDVVLLPDRSPAPASK
jgi:LysM repeat protein